MRFPFVQILSVAVFLAFAPAVSAQDPKGGGALPDTLAKAVASYYNAETQMKDVSVDLQQAREFPERVQVFEGRYYWKAPNRSKIVPNASLPDSEQSLRPAGEDVVPVRGFAQLFAPLAQYECVESKDGDFVKIECKPKPGASHTGTFTAWIHPDGRISRITMSRPAQGGGMSEMEAKFESEERDGKRLLIGSSMTTQGKTNSIHWDYEKVGEIYLVVKETQQDPGSKRVTTYKNYQVDKGVDDAVFGGK